ANLLLHCPMTRQARQAMLEYADRDARHRAYSTADRSAPTSVLQSDQGAFDARGARLSPHNWPWSPTAHHAHSGGSARVFKQRGQSDCLLSIQGITFSDNLKPNSIKQCEVL